MSRALARLRIVFERAQYDERGLSRAVRGNGRIGLDEGLAALRLGPHADERLSVLVRLFLGGDTIDATLAAAALDPLDAADLGELLTVADGTVRARVRIEPFDGLLVISDRPKPLRAAHVLGIGRGTRMLAALTVRRPVESALDLCTGSGALALLAARHAERVVGVDLNPRALRLAQVNAALNGVGIVDWRRGDLYEPVAGERFDLIVANPPFVVSPNRELLFRDGGLEDDALSREVVAGAATRLREGGFALVMCSWVARARGAWSTPLRSWLRGSGCDAWLLHHSTDTPAAYALQWNLRPGRALATSADAAEDWVDYYRSRGIEAIATGIVILRRRKGRNWVREDELARTPLGAAGAHVERVFAGVDLLRSSTSDRELLAVGLVPAPKTIVVERREPSGAFVRARLAVEEGLPVAGRIPEACVGVLAALDGRRSLGEALQVVAQTGGTTAEMLAGECLPALRDLLAHGLLIAAEAASPRIGPGEP